MTTNNQQSSQKTAFQSTMTDPRKSALQKYQDVVIGQPGLFSLLKYEVLTFFLGSLPGALGLLLRKKLYRFLFGQVGKNVVFGKSITLRHPHKITIGDNVVVDDYAVLDAKGVGNTGIKVGDDVMIGRNSVISCKNGNIKIGKNSNIAMNCFIQSGKEVVIGKNVLFSAYCYVIGGGDHRTNRVDVPIIAQGQTIKGVTIEDNCLLGAGAMVQDGVCIARDSIIGTGAVVRSDIPEFSIAVGVPARVLKSRK